MTFYRYYLRRLLRGRGRERVRDDEGRERGRKKEWEVDGRERCTGSEQAIITITFHWTVIISAAFGCISVSK